MNTGLKHPSPLLPSATLIAQAKESGQALVQMLSPDTETQEFTIKQGNREQTVRLPTAATELLMDILVHLSQGHAVQVVPVSSELSTQQAAELLRVSRPYLIKLLDEGKIAYRKVGSHRRVLYSDLMAFKSQESAARRTTLDELTAQAQELDMGY